jgi:hypothetical protein
VKLLVGKVTLRLLIPMVLGSYVLLLTGCARLTLFVVVNRSDRPIEVRYKIKQSSSDIRLVCDPPAVMMASQLGTGQHWQELSDAQYKLERDSRLLTLSLKPGEALKITVIHTPQNEQDELMETQRFCIEEIEVTGDVGGIRLQGRQSYYGFRTEPGDFRALTYK